jgi:hypothetical protein
MGFEKKEIAVYIQIHMSQTIILLNLDQYLLKETEEELLRQQAATYSLSTRIVA